MVLSDRDPTQTDPEKGKENKHPGPGAPPASPPQPLGPSPEVREVLYRAFAVGVIMILACALVLIGIFSLGSGLLSIPSAGAAIVTTTEPTHAPSLAATTTPLPVTSSIEYLPAKMYVGVSVEKNSAGKVTVNFLGGEGRSFVKEIQARLTRSDGTVVTGTMDPQADFPQIVLDGTKATDHIEVFARMYSGKLYKITEQDVAYPVRTG